MLESADPAQARGEEVSVREVLDQASGRIHAELADQPDVRAKMDAIIGIVYTSLAKYGEAETFLARALELQRDQNGPQHPATPERTKGKAPHARKRHEQG